MAALKEHVKLFIVQRLACYDTPSEVAAAVKEEFGLELDRSHVGFYDPTTHKGRDLGAKMREHFFVTRKAFLDDLNQIPMANKSVRVRELQKLFYTARNNKNAVLAAALAEQIAKEVGGVYTNKMKIGGDTADPFIVWLQSVGNSSLPVVQDVDGELIEQEPEPVPRVTWKPNGSA